MQNPLFCIIPRKHRFVRFDVVRLKYLSNIFILFIFFLTLQKTSYILSLSRANAGKPFFSKHIYLPENYHIAEF